MVNTQQNIQEYNILWKYAKIRYIGCFRYFNGQLRNGRPNYGHIRHQRLQIYKKWRFVFEFTQIVLTGFPGFFFGCHIG